MLVPLKPPLLLLSPPTPHHNYIQRQLAEAQVTANGDAKKKAMEAAGGAAGKLGE